MPETDNIIGYFFEMFFAYKFYLTREMNKTAIDIPNNGYAIPKYKNERFESKGNFIYMTSG
jgi:hypothetical protein